MGRKNRKKNKGGGGSNNPVSPTNLDSSDLEAASTDLASGPPSEDETQPPIDTSSAVAELLGLNLSLDPSFADVSQLIGETDLEDTIGCQMHNRKKKLPSCRQRTRNRTVSLENYRPK